jgi:hypothetical protein
MSELNRREKELREAVSVVSSSSDIQNLVLSYEKEEYWSIRTGRINFQWEDTLGECHCFIQNVYLINVYGSVTLKTNDPEEVLNTWRLLDLKLADEGVELFYFIINLGSDRFPRYDTKFAKVKQKAFELLAPRFVEPVLPIGDDFDTFYNTYKK